MLRSVEAGTWQREAVPGRPETPGRAHLEAGPNREARASRREAQVCQGSKPLSWLTQQAEEGCGLSGAVPWAGLGMSL